MTQEELENKIVEVQRQLDNSARLSIVKGIDYSWKARTHRWRLSNLKTTLNVELEYLKHEHFPLIKFCRKTANVVKR